MHFGWYTYRQGSLSSLIAPKILDTFHSYNIYTLIVHYYRYNNRLSMLYTHFDYLGLENDQVRNACTPFGHFDLRIDLQGTLYTPIGHFDSGMYHGHSACIPSANFDFGIVPLDSCGSLNAHFVRCIFLSGIPYNQTDCFGLGTELHHSACTPFGHFDLRIDLQGTLYTPIGHFDFDSDRAIMEL